jgi:predicted nucleotidyltransferase
MYVPPESPTGIDDIDIMSAVVPDREYFLGLKEYGSRGTKEYMIDHWDVVSYEIRKLMGLFSKGNPNVLSMLWVDEEFIIKRTIEGQGLRDCREMFVGKHVFNPFIGYARGQFKRMTNYADGSDRYRTGHMGEKRKRLVEEFGYDTKNAAHLIRLLRMGIEFLQTGKLYVNRANIDAAELLAIKRGDWDIRKVNEVAATLFVEAEEALYKSQLPDGVDMDEISKKCAEIVGWALVI